MAHPDDLPTQLAALRSRVSRLWRRRVLAHRRLLAGVCAGLAVLLLVQALRSPVPAVVATSETPTPASFAAAHPDAVVVPVRLPDAGMAALLGEGDHIDLIATDPETGGTRTVAHGAVVVAVSAVTGDAGSGGRLVVVGVTSGAVDDVASASVRDFLTYVYAH